MASATQQGENPAAEKLLKPATSDGGSALISKESVPLLFAFLGGYYDVLCFKQYKAYPTMMTGNVLNLCMKVGNRDPLDVKFLLAAVAHYLGGYTLFKHLDLRLGSTSVKAAAPLVLLLHSAADNMRMHFPDSKWHMMLLAIAGGLINGVCTEKLKVVTVMLTGHLQKISGDLAESSSKGLSKERWNSTVTSIKVVFLFCLGVTLSMAAGNKKNPLPAMGRNKFGVVGAIYAAILLLH